MFIYTSFYTTGIMPFEYYINGEKGNTEMPDAETKNKQFFNYRLATIIQLLLLLAGLMSFISGQVALFNGSTEKTFNHNAIMFICIGFIGIIAAIKSLYKGEN
jgi:hypothetical protein